MWLSEDELQRGMVVLATGYDPADSCFAVIIHLWDSEEYGKIFRVKCECGYESWQYYEDLI